MARSRKCRGWTPLQAHGAAMGDYRGDGLAKSREGSKSDLASARSGNPLLAEVTYPVPSEHRKSSCKDPW